MDIINILTEKAKDNDCRIWVAPKHQHSANYSLMNEKMLCAFDDVLQEANYLDCIWFKGEKYVPAIFKICEKDFLIEALYHLKTMKELIPAFITSYFLIAKDELEYQIPLELKKPIFKGFAVEIILMSSLESFNFNSELKH